MFSETNKAALSQLEVEKVQKSSQSIELLLQSNQEELEELAQDIQLPKPEELRMETLVLRALLDTNSLQTDTEKKFFNSLWKPLQSWIKQKSFWSLALFLTCVIPAPSHLVAHSQTSQQKQVFREQKKKLPQKRPKHTISRFQNKMHKLPQSEVTLHLAKLKPGQQIPLRLGNEAFCHPGEQLLFGFTLGRQSGFLYLFVYESNNGWEQLYPLSSAQHPWGKGQKWEVGEVYLSQKNIPLLYTIQNQSQLLFFVALKSPQKLDQKSIKNWFTNAFIAPSQKRVRPKKHLQRTLAFDVVRIQVVNKK